MTRLTPKALRDATSYYAEQGPTLQKRPHRMNIRIALIATALLLAPAMASAIEHAPAPVNAQTKNVLLPEGTLIRIRMLNELSSSYSHAGDPFRWVVSDDVLVNKRVVIPVGTLGFGKVSKVSPAHGGRVPGWLKLAFDPVKLSDGQVVDIAVTHASVIADQNAKNGYAPAAETVAGVMIPYFFLFEGLRKGDDMIIPQNAVFHVGVLEDVFVTEDAVAISATPTPAPTATPAATPTPASAPPPVAPAASAVPATPSQ